MYRETTDGFTVEVRPVFVEEQSDPQAGYFFYAYHVKIINESEGPAQLVSRHWIITDGRGCREEVKGPGVVGEQPQLEPGESFEYTSACPLPTPTGNMRGKYLLKTDNGKDLKISIPLFFLRHPSTFQ